VLGLLSFFLFFITSIPGLICGIMGLKRIARSQAGGGGPRLTGRGLAIAGIVLSTITTLASVVLGLLVWPAFQAARDSAAQWNTVNNFKQIMLAMHTAEQGLSRGDRRCRQQAAPQLAGGDPSVPRR
jgi:hypothetical protein